MLRNRSIVNHVASSFSQLELESGVQEFRSQELQILGRPISGLWIVDLLQCDESFHSAAVDSSQFQALDRALPDSATPELLQLLNSWLLAPTQ